MKRGFRFLLFALFFVVLFTGLLCCKQESPDDTVRNVQVTLNSGEGEWLFQKNKKEWIVEVPYGERLRDYLPEQHPYKENYEYLGMFEDKEGKIEYGYDEPVYSPITLYAQYRVIAREHKVAFILGDEEIPQVTVKPNHPVTVPKLSRDCPVVWYYDDQFTRRFDIEKNIENDCTLYGLWADFSGSWKKFISFLNSQNDEWFNDESVTRGFIIKDDETTTIDGLAPLSKEVPELEIYFLPVSFNDTDFEPVSGGSLTSGLYKRKDTDFDRCIRENPTGQTIQQKLSILSKAKWKKLYFNFREMPNLSEISDSSFSGCTSLYKIYLPSSVTTIGREAFLDCSSLCELVIPSAVTKIGEAAFKNCSSIANEITIPDNVTEIAAQTFRDCKSIPNVVLTGNVYRIKELAFMGCEELKQVVIPNGVRYVYNGSFAYLGKLDYIELPKSIKNSGEGEPVEYGIGAYAFYKSSCDNKKYKGNESDWRDNRLRPKWFDVIPKDDDFKGENKQSFESNLLFSEWDFLEANYNTGWDNYYSPQ